MASSTEIPSISCLTGTFTKSHIVGTVSSTHLDVYKRQGGASLGLMECVACAVKENGGKVIGVVPAKLEENGKVSILLDEEIHTRNLSDRCV